MIISFSKRTATHLHLLHLHLLHMLLLGSVHLLRYEHPLVVVGARGGRLLGHGLLQVLHELVEPAGRALVVLEYLVEGGVLQLVGQALPQRLLGPVVVGQPQVAPDHVLEQPGGRLLCDGVDHLAEDHGDVGEALVSVADVVQAAHV